MTSRAAILAMAMGAALWMMTACSTLPGQPAASSIPQPPDKVLAFESLYSQNCAGCHGTNGKGGAAISLADPIYLTIASDTDIRKATASGVAGTAMPAFAQSAGGMLTDAQIDAIVEGVRGRWSKPGTASHGNPPPYATSTPGIAAHGADVFRTYCASCHGDATKKDARAGTILDPAYLALASDQGLRTTIIAGRADLGSPDWCGDVPGKCMSPQEVSDVVAWLASQRVAYPGQPYAAAQSAAGVQQ